MIHKEGAGDDFCSFGWTLPNGKQERPIPGERFSAPMSEKDALQNLSLPERIQKTIRAPLEQATNSDLLDFDLLAREAFEVSALLEENFDRYADSLLDQNIIPLIILKYRKNCYFLSIMSYLMALISLQKNSGKILTTQFMN